MDPAFAPQSGLKRKPAIRTIAGQSDGKLLICGDFDRFNDLALPSIARLSGASLDTTFTPPWNTTQLPYIAGQIRAVVPLDSGRILIGGSFMANVNGTGDRRYNVACLNADGTVVTSGFYNTLDSSSGVVNALGLQSDGKILVGGCSLTLNVYPPNTNTYCLIRLTPDGSPDYSYPWRQAKRGYIQSIQVFTNDTVYTNRAVISGVMPSSDGSHTTYLLSLTEKGSEINSFEAANGAVAATALQSNGKRLLAGFFTNAGGKQANRVARLNSDQSLDESFAIGTGANAEVRCLAVQTDGKIILAGGFTSFNSSPCGRIVRLQPDGVIDTSFNPGAGANDRIYDLRLGQNGNILIVGAFSAFNGESRGGIAHLAADGTLLGEYITAGAQNSILAKIKTAEAQPDGRILVGGDFTEAGGRHISGIARFNVDGSFDPTFDPGTGVDGYVQGITLQPDGRILVAGYFGSVNGAARTSLARLNSDGSVDESFTPCILKLDGSLSILRKPVLSADGILVLGHFRSINGADRNYVARLKYDGSLDAGFDARFAIVGWDPFRPGVVLNGGSPIVYTAAVLPDAKVIIGGSVTWDGLARGYLLRLDPTGKLDASFVPKSVATNVVVSTGTVKKLIPFSDGKILICGDFTEFKDGSWSPPGRGRIARFLADGALDDTFKPEMGADNSIEDMALQSDGKILIAGAFRNYDVVYYPAPTNALRVARLTPNGGLDNTFNSSGGPNKTAYSVVWLPSDRAIVTGDFTDYRGLPRLGLANILATSTQSVAQGFAAWVKNSFTSADPAGDQTMDADPDADGVVNLLEYAFGLNPKSADRSGLPHADFLLVGSQTYLALKYLRPKTAPTDLLYEWQTSADLSSWQPLSVVQVGSPALQGDRMEVTVRPQTPITASSPGFYRLQVKGN